MPSVGNKRNKKHFLKGSFEMVTKSFENACRYIYGLVTAPSRAQGQMMLFALGLSVLAFGLMGNAFAQGAGLGDYNDERLENALSLLFTYLEGAFGALVMVAAGIGAIMSAAFGQYRAALGMLVVAVGAFILRSILDTFFNAQNIELP